MFVWFVSQSRPFVCPSLLFFLSRCLSPNNPTLEQLLAAPHVHVVLIPSSLSWTSYFAVLELTTSLSNLSAR